MKNWSTQNWDVFWRIRTFCSRLGVLLDREESGWICFDRLLQFISNALDTERDAPHDSWPVVWRKSASINWNGSWAKISAACSTTSTTRPQLNPLPAASNAKSRKSQWCPGPAPRGVRGPRVPAHGPGSARSERERSPEQGTPRLSRCHLLYHQAVLAARMLGFCWQKPTPRDLWFGIVFHFVMDWRWIRYPGTHHFLMVKIHEFVCNGFGWNNPHSEKGPWISLPFLVLRTLRKGAQIEKEIKELNLQQEMPLRLQWSVKDLERIS